MKRFELKFRQPKTGSETSGTLEEVFVPAFLNHVTELAMSMQSGHSSAIVNIENNSNGGGSDDDVDDDVKNEHETEEEQVNSLPAEHEDQDHLQVPNVTVTILIITLTRPRAIVQWIKYLLGTQAAGARTQVYSAPILSGTPAMCTLSLSHNACRHVLLHE